MSSFEQEQEQERELEREREELEREQEQQEQPGIAIQWIGGSGLDRYYTRRGAARLAKVSLSTIDRARAQGELRADREGYTPLFIGREIARWMAECGERAIGVRGQLYSGGAAARYLNIDRQMIHYHVKRGNLVPDERDGRRIFFFKATLDKFKPRIRPNKRRKIAP